MNEQNDELDFVISQHHHHHSDSHNHSHHEHHSHHSNHSHHEHHSHHKHKIKKWKKRLLIILAVLLSIILVVTATYFILYYIGKDQLINKNSGINNPDISDSDDLDIDDDGNIIEYKGVTYEYNQNMTTMLFMGVDVNSIKNTSTNYGNNGQADALYLMALDTDNGKSDVICISRDSMADVDVYSKSGELIGTRRKQICLAYAYGDKRHTSCKNVKTAVERLMFGIPINTYFAIDLSGVAPLTNAMGGITVTTYDTYGNANGTKTLRGQAAMNYVRGRDISILESNNMRMSNQKEFLRCFISSAKQKTKQDITVPVKMYNIATDYSVSDINASKITYLATKFISNGTDAEFHTVPGTVTVGEGNHAEFNVDNDALFELILDVFYKKKVK